jgi:hypothetical protein
VQQAPANDIEQAIGIGGHPGISPALSRPGVRKSVISACIITSAAGIVKTRCSCRMD